MLCPYMSVFSSIQAVLVSQHDNCNDRNTYVSSVIKSRPAVNSHTWCTYIKCGFKPVAVIIQCNSLCVMLLRENNQRWGGAMKRSSRYYAEVDSFPTTPCPEVFLGLWLLWLFVVIHEWRLVLLKNVFIATRNVMERLQNSFLSA